MDLDIQRYYALPATEALSVFRAIRTFRYFLLLWLAKRSAIACPETTGTFYVYPGQCFGLVEFRLRLA